MFESLIRIGDVRIDIRLPGDDAPRWLDVPTWRFDGEESGPRVIRIEPDGPTVGICEIKAANEASSNYVAAELVTYERDRASYLSLTIVH